MTHSSSNPKTSEAVVVLRYGEREFALAPGRYLAGRDRTCNLVIDRQVVSRRHAFLRVFQDSRLLLKDLDSHNGVCVNGQCIGDAAVSLKPGDWFVIGGETIEIGTKPDLSHWETISPEIVTERDHIMLIDSRDPIPHDAQATDDLSMMWTIAERAMASGQTREAEDLLAEPLRGILSDVKSEQQTNRSVRTKALSCALKLAQETRKPRWLDYALDILIADNSMCTEQRAEEVLLAHTHVGCVDTKRLHRCLEMLRQTTPTNENLKVIALLESMRGTELNER